MARAIAVLLKVFPLLVAVLLSTDAAKPKRKPVFNPTSKPHNPYLPPYIASSGNKPFYRNVTHNEYGITCADELIVDPRVPQPNPRYHSGVGTFYEYVRQAKGPGDLRSLDDTPVKRLSALTVWQWREEARAMMTHAMSSYMTHAYPWDELKPLSCTGRRWDDRQRGTLDDSLGGFALTLIDGLDALALTGDLAGFRCAVSLVVNEVRLDNNAMVNVFETSIRVLGGLISAHLLASDPRFKIFAIGSTDNFPRPCPLTCRTPCLHVYEGQLLAMAVELADRLLPAFDTVSGLPYYRINLSNGKVDEGARETCTAAGGTFLLEWGLLTRLTGHPIYGAVARRAAGALWSRRASTTNLVGTSIDCVDASWRGPHTGIGAGVDSFYEYQLKASISLNDEPLYHSYSLLSSAVSAHLDHAGVHLESSFTDGKPGVKPPVISSLQAFYPGLEVLAGHVNEARVHMIPLLSLWKKFRALPEAYDITAGVPVYFAKDAPLRPELLESTFHLYTATRDPSYLWAAAGQMHAVINMSTVECGFGSIADVHTGRLDDRMDSYFVAETAKYSFLVFDYALRHWFDPAPQAQDDPSFVLPSDTTAGPSQAIHVVDLLCDTAVRSLGANLDVNETDRLTSEHIAGTPLCCWNEDSLSPWPTTMSSASVDAIGDTAAIYARAENCSVGKFSACRARAEFAFHTCGIRQIGKRAHPFAFVRAAGLRESAITSAPKTKPFSNIFGAEPPQELLRRATNAANILPVLEQMPGSPEDEWRGGLLPSLALDEEGTLFTTEAHLVSLTHPAIVRTAEFATPSACRNTDYGAKCPFEHLQPHRHAVRPSTHRWKHKEGLPLDPLEDTSTLVRRFPFTGLDPDSDHFPRRKVLSRNESDCAVPAVHGSIGYDDCHENDVQLEFVRSMDILLVPPCIISTSAPGTDQERALQACADSLRQGHIDTNMLAAALYPYPSLGSLELQGSELPSFDAVIAPAVKDAVHVHIHGVLPGVVPQKPDSAVASNGLLPLPLVNVLVGWNTFEKSGGLQQLIDQFSTAAASPSAGEASHFVRDSVIRASSLVTEALQLFRKGVNTNADADRIVRLLSPLTDEKMLNIPSEMAPKLGQTPVVGAQLNPLTTTTLIAVFNESSNNGPGGLQKHLLVSQISIPYPGSGDQCFDVSVSLSASRAPVAGFEAIGWTRTDFFPPRLLQKVVNAGVDANLSVADALRNTALHNAFDAILLHCDPLTSYFVMSAVPALAGRSLVLNLHRVNKDVGQTAQGHNWDQGARIPISEVSVAGGRLSPSLTLNVSAADFGPFPTFHGIDFDSIAIAWPMHACSESLTFITASQKTVVLQGARSAVVVLRGSCTFGDKARAVAAGGGIAVIIVDPNPNADQGNSPYRPASPVDFEITGDGKGPVSIPAAFVAGQQAKLLIEFMGLQHS